VYCIIIVIIIVIQARAPSTTSYNYVVEIRRCCVCFVFDDGVLASNYNSLQVQTIIIQVAVIIIINSSIITVIISYSTFDKKITRTPTTRA
jgi:hypothetical protein